MHMLSRRRPFRAAGLLFSALLLAAALPAGEGWEGVPPDTEPPFAPAYGMDIEAWWARHPFNPASRAHQPAILSPEPRIDVQADFGGDLQKAIDALGPEGGTLLLAAGDYGEVDCVRKSNVHLLGEEGAVLRSLRISGTPLGYTAFCNALHNLGDEETIRDWRNPSRNIYVRNIVFDGGGRIVEETPHDYALQLRHSGVRIAVARDIVFDHCVFRNYRLAKHGHPGLVSAHRGPNNLWFRDCTFLGPQRLGAYIDGSHALGFLRCTFRGAFPTAAISLFCNHDLNYDLDGDGVLRRNELRNPQYTVVEHCVFSGGTYVSAVVDATQAADLLYRFNRVEGRTNRFARIKSRMAPLYTLPAFDCSSVRFIGNVAGPLATFVHADARRQADGTFPPGVISRLELRGNVVEIGAAKNLLHVDGPVAAPPRLIDNAVNRPGAEPGGAYDDDHTPPPPPTGLRLEKRSDATLTLAWEPVKDETRLAGYAILLDGEGGGTIGYACAPRYADERLAPATLRRYRVVAYDRNANISPPGPAFAARTLRARRVSLLEEPIRLFEMEPGTRRTVSFDVDLAEARSARLAINLTDLDAAEEGKLFFNGHRLAWPRAVVHNAGAWEGSVALPFDWLRPKGNELAVEFSSTLGGRTRGYQLNRADLVLGLPEPDTAAETP